MLDKILDNWLSWFILSISRWGRKSISPTSSAAFERSLFGMKGMEKLQLRREKIGVQRGPSSSCARADRGDIISTKPLVLSRELDHCRCVKADNWYLSCLSCIQHQPSKGTKPTVCTRHMLTPPQHNLNPTHLSFPCSQVFVHYAAPCGYHNHHWAVRASAV